MTTQFNRQVQVLIEGADGVIDVSELRVKFTVTVAMIQTPAAADITIYNLSRTNAEKIQREGTKVVLNVGYPGSLSRLFIGEVKQVRIGRENGTDTYLNILAASGDAAYNNAVVSASLPAGSTQDAVHTTLLGAMQKYGITAGEKVSLSTQAMPRGQVIFGMVKDHARDFAKDNGLFWNLEGNQFNIGSLSWIKNDKDVIVLNSETGLVGTPIQTMQGITGRCLLNPRVKYGRQLKLNNGEVQDAKLSLDYNTLDPMKMPPKRADGLYRVYYTMHTGDTRGNDWYTDFVCTTDDAPIFAPLFMNVVPGDD